MPGRLKLNEASLTECPVALPQVLGVLLGASLLLLVLQLWQVLWENLLLLVLQLLQLSSELLVVPHCWVVWVRGALQLCSRCLGWAVWLVLLLVPGPGAGPFVA